MSIAVDPVSDPPVARDDARSTDEDTPLTVPAPGVLVNDGDADGEPVTAVAVAGPANGALTLNSDGSFTYTPNADFNGTDSFSYRARSGADESAPATVSITVNPVNDPPVARDDAGSTDEDTSLRIAALANDTDVDRDPLTALVIDGPAHGTLTLNADGSFAYTPAPDYFGPDAFTYRANDGTAVSNLATVAITVRAVDDPATVTVAAGGTCASSDGGGTMTLTLADPDSPLGAVVLTVTSSNPTLVPVAKVSFAGSGLTRTMTVATVSGKTGTAALTIRAGSGGGSATVTVQAAGGGNNTLTGTAGPDMLLAQQGIDVVRGLGGPDLLCGGQGNDTLDAGEGADAIDGGQGNDVLIGAGGADVLVGGPGNDRLTGGADADRFSGGDGDDIATDFTPAQGDTKDGTIP